MSRLILSRFLLVVCLLKWMVASGALADELDFIRHVYPGEAITQVVPADLDSDGVLDLVATGGNVVYVLKGNGDGTFELPRLFPAIPSVTNFSLDVCDVNSDGFVDVVWGGVEPVGINLNNGDGTLSAPLQPFSATYDGLSIVCADFNNDDRVDVAFGTLQSAIVQLGIGGGAFELSQVFEFNGGLVFSLQAIDLNDDAVLDLVGTSPGQFFVAFGMEDGTFGEPETYVTPIGFGGLDVADVNGDQIQDVLVATRDGIAIYPGLGGGLFSQIPSLQFGEDSTWVIARDFDNDGIVELAVTSITTSEMQFFEGSETNEFELCGSVVVGMEPWISATADLNQDGRLDLITAIKQDDFGIAVQLNHTGTEPGDVNLDGAVNLLDRTPFVELLASGSYQVEADINRDGLLDLLDVAPFVDLLSGG